MSSDKSHFIVSFIMRDKVTRQCPQITTFEEKGEPKRIRTEVPLLIYQPNALLLGQTDIYQPNALPLGQTDIYQPNALPLGQTDIYQPNALPLGQTDIYQPNALPLGQTDSLISKYTENVLFYLKLKADR